MPSEADAAAGVVITKRQRRKLLAKSTKHVTPQQPKLTNAEARAKAYVRVAGINVVPKMPLDVSSNLDDPEMRFGRLLGSTDQRKRHLAVAQLKAYLTSRCSMDRAGLSELDLMKLWKGLWYTLYMADKTPVQDELSKHLAELLWCVAGTEEEDEYAAAAYLEATGGAEDDEDDGDDEDEDDDEGVIMQEVENTLGDHDGDEEDDDDEDDDDEDDDDEDDMDEEDEEDHVHGEHCNHRHDHNDHDEEDSVDDTTVPHCRGAHLASLFIKTFFSTIRREWGNMDKYRVDKFYTLIRLMMGQVYKYMALRHWNLGILRLFNDTIFEEILSVTPNGLRCHLIDLTMQELAKVNAEAPMPLTEATFCDVLEPYFAMVQGMDDKVVQQRIVDNILLKFLVDYSVVGEAADEKLVFDQIHVGTIAEFIFHLGSDTTTRDEYRKNLYDAHKEYQRRIKRTGRDVDIGDEEDDNEDVDDDDDEAPQLKLCDDYDEGEEVVEEEDAEPEQEEEPEPEPEAKKSKKKRKRVRGVMETEPIVTEVDEPVTQTNKTKKAKDKRDSVEERPKKKSKKDKKDSIVSVKGEDGKPKKKSKKGNRDSVQSSDEPVDEFATPVTEQKKVKKAKKVFDEEYDKETATVDAAQKNVKKANKVVDEEFVISVAEQKKAKKAAAEEAKALSSPPAVMKEKTKKKRKETEEEKEKRRVSFGRINHSKSHKASMRDLKNASPKPSPITPDKSILRVKTPTSKPKRIGGKIAKRKKAADYF
jgi:hypothetical protein